MWCCPYVPCLVAFRDFMKLLFENIFSTCYCPFFREEEGIKVLCIRMLCCFSLHCIGSAKIIHICTRSLFYIYITKLCTRLFFTQVQGINPIAIISQKNSAVLPSHTLYKAGLATYLVLLVAHFFSIFIAPDLHRLLQSHAYQGQHYVDCQAVLKYK